MLWFKKQAASETPVKVEPVSLGIDLDSGIFAQKLQQFVTATSDVGGVEAFVDALNKKQIFFAELVSEDAIDGLSEDSVLMLLDCVFPARRRLLKGLNQVPHNVVVSQLRHLLYGDDTVEKRLQSFVDVIEIDDKKVRRAAWDFAAEVLHFSAPEQYPLMCRWVWDQHAQSGATREFIRANDTMPNIPIGMSVAEFECARVWLSDQLEQQGFYRDIPWMIDLVLAQAYAEYVMAMSNGMGMMGSEFGAKMEPITFVSKLLGIDPARRGGKSRVKNTVIH